MRPRQAPVVPYGRRTGLKDADAGVRQVAPTYGRPLHLTSSSKSPGPLVVESPAERLVNHLLTLDPRVRAFEPQPFTVDLLDGCLLSSPEEVEAARKRHKGREGRKFYTPDFAVRWLDRPQAAVEVKLEGFEGNDDYDAVLQKAASLLDAAGYAFTKVVIPADQRIPLRFNVPLLRKASRQKSLWPVHDLVERVEGFLDGGPRTLSALCSELGLSPNLVPHLLMMGVAHANLLAQFIAGAMSLQAAHGDLSHLCLLEEFVA